MVSAALFEEVTARQSEIEMRNVEEDIHFAKKTHTHANKQLRTHTAYTHGREHPLFREIKEKSEQQAVQRKSGRAIGETIYYGTLTASEAEVRYDIKLRRMRYITMAQRDMTSSPRKEERTFRVIIPRPAKLGGSTRGSRTRALSNNIPGITEVKRSKERLSSAEQRGNSRGPTLRV